ncbi:MAG: adenylate cyclase regulatory domain-containing protein, partial [Jatrophihabitantaceae bacterium]
MPDQSLAGRLEQILLGGQRRFTRAEAAERAGISLDRASQLWRALGFASVGDDERAFTDSDVTALANAAELVNTQLVDADSLQSVTRMVGQSMSRLAEWQSRLLVELLAERPDAIPDGDLAAFISKVEPVLEQVQSHVWRRQLAAAAQRMLAAQGTNQAADVQAVGFVDLAGYTSLSRQLGVAELAEVRE